MAWSYIASILVFYGILVIINLPAPIFGIEFESGGERKLWYAPPGFVIPIVWFALFTLLGIARQDLVRINEGGMQWLLFGLAFLCATYAYYTLGLARLTNISALWYGLAGNIVVIVFAAFVVWKLFPVNKIAAYLTMPVIVWTIFASVIVVGEMRLAKLI
jgi:tryptophan-rich sensory protein